jgi:hypothetical protein
MYTDCGAALLFEQVSTVALLYSIFSKMLLATPTSLVESGEAYNSGSAERLVPSSAIRRQ